MNTKVRFSLVTLACVLTMPATAQVNYAVSGNTAYVTNSPGASGNIIIASTYNGLPVTSIGDGAFEYCTSLTNVTIPDSVTSLGDYPFWDCTSLTSVSIPDSVTNIGVAPFGNCTSLTNVSVGVANSVYSSLDGVLFNKAQTTLIQFPSGGGSSYAIPSSVTNIENSAFINCSSLMNVTIPNSVTRIGDTAFGGTGLTSVTLGNNVAIIGFGAFQDCAALTSVTIPDSVTNIGDYAFEGCSSVTNFAVGAFNSVYSSLDGVLFNKSQTTLIQFPARRGGSYAVPGSVTSIGIYAFEGATSLTNVIIGNGVATIGHGAFSATSLTSVTIPTSVTNLGDDAFAGATNLTGVNIPGSVREIGAGAFVDCIRLVKVTIDSGVQNIAESAFNGCLTLRSVSIPGSTTNIGSAAFYQCVSLTNATILNGVVSIGDTAFKYAGLTSITIPDSVVSIGTEAFSVCSRMTNITIGRGLTRLGADAFASSGGASGYGNLARANFMGNAPTVITSPIYGTNAFKNDNFVIVYYLPGTTGWGITFNGRPTARWSLPTPLIFSNGPDFGVQTNAFGFRVSWATNIAVVVEACANLAAPNWLPLTTNDLSGGWFYFSDPEWTNYPSRIYRVRSQ